jgi:hypothetical protein
MDRAADANNILQVPCCVTPLATSTGRGAGGFGCAPARSEGRACEADKFPEKTGFGRAPEVTGYTSNYGQLDALTSQSVSVLRAYTAFAYVGAVPSPIINS